MVPTGITFCTSTRVGAGAHTRTHSILGPSLSLSEAHPSDDGLLGRSRHPPHPVTSPACFLHLETFLCPPTSSQTLGKPEQRTEGPPTTRIPLHCPSPSMNPCLLSHPGQAVAKLGGGRLGHRAKTPNQALKASDLRCHL